VPEGDTIHKIAAVLAPRLCGQTVGAAHLKKVPSQTLAGCRVLDVASKGKHLFITFDNGVVLRSHLGMYGSWHRYAVGEPWRKPARFASIVLEIGACVYVCFSARDVELLASSGYRLADARHRLGPDLAREFADPMLAVRRAGELSPPCTCLADLLLDQRVACGIGNVYKSEVLFLQRLHPGRTMGETPPESLAALYRLARELLRRNLGGGPRTTRFVRDGRGVLWVYGRGDQPCLRCGAEIRHESFGVNPRSTYWCPGCQPPPKEGLGRPHPQGGSSRGESKPTG
jgi:endonuclease-8